MSRSKRLELGRSVTLASVMRYLNHPSRANLFLSAFRHFLPKDGTGSLHFHMTEPRLPHLFVIAPLRKVCSVRAGDSISCDSRNCQTLGASPAKPEGLQSATRLLATRRRH